MKFNLCARVLTLLCCFVVCHREASANRVVNGGFESGLDSWTFTGDGIHDIASISSDTPSGVGSSADLDINRGEFGLPLPWLIQDVPVAPGEMLTFSASVREVEPNSPTDAWIAAQIWMLPSSDSGTILSSAAMFFTDPAWTTQSTDITVPPGATIARVLFTPQNPAFGVGSGQYRIDDVSVVVPEPAAAVMLTSGALASAVLRRSARARAAR